MLDLDVISQTVAALWRNNGGPAGTVTLTPCAISGNNRVYMVDGSDGTRIVTKVYFRHAPGDRDRLQAEWRFLSHALRAGVDCVPRPIGFDNAARLALYSFVEGKKLDSPRIGTAEISAAANFIRDLNGPGSVNGAADVPHAAEACFTLNDHMATVDRRLARLAAIQPQLDVDIQAIALLAEMQAYWRQLKTDLEAGLAALGQQPDQPIPDHERMLSPSDFGFHNALLGSDGHLSFIDFEYAGWDDVAKLVADFFFQPAIPVPPHLFEIFMGQILEGRPLSCKTQQRIRLLQPLFGVKWICILLNLFLADLAERRRFADPHYDEMQSKVTQLTKARAAFQTLIGTSWHT